MSDEELRFSVDSLLLGEIGERLVTKDYIALAELVKNAYDADAPSLTIKFLDVIPDEISPCSAIEISDTGNGMNFEQVINFWMRIATDNKLRSPESPKYGRRKAGSKGIGRFACARLARKLILETTGLRKKSDLKEPDTWDYTTVTFEWEKYEPGTILTTIPNNYTTKKLSKASTGTTLRLIGLRDSWSQNDFDIMRRQILGLSVASGARRSNFKEDPGFQVSLDAPNFEKGQGLLSDQVMDAGWGRLRGSVAKDGTVTLKLEALKIDPPATFDLPDKIPELVGTHFDVAIIWNKKEYNRDNKTLALYSIGEIFREWSGIKVFLDGFRIYPYGDIGDDWLGIERRQARSIGKTDKIFEKVCKNFGIDETRALLNQPKNQNLLGKIFVTNSLGAKFDVLINREGFVESDEVLKLKSLLQTAIEWITIYYDHFLYSFRHEKLIQTAKDFQTVNKSSSSLTNTEEKSPVIVDAAINVMERVFDDYKENVGPEKREEIAKQANTAIDVIHETISQMNRQITALRTMASAGALLLVLSHETKDMINKLSSIANSVKILTDNPRSYKKEELQALSTSIIETRDRLSDQLTLFGNVSRSVAATEKHRIKLYELASESISSFKGLSDEFNITINNAIDKDIYPAPMLKGEVYSIFINLLSNAVKATIAGHGHNIKIEAIQSLGNIALRFYDDGIGLSKEGQQSVLKTGLPDPENRLYKALAQRLGPTDSLSVGFGSGLGLTIIREILATYGQNLRFVETHLPWKTCVEVTLPL